MTKAPNYIQFPVKSIILFFLMFFITTIHSQELLKYSCLSDRVEVDRFIKKRSFDENGIIKSKGLYHPLNICQYGLLCYDKFIEDGDSSYYEAFVNQYQYFTDNSKVDSMFNGKGIGLPYRFNFWDLKSPWYSGMTQGSALSYLLRYFLLTNDSSAIDISKKIAYTLLQKQEVGGTISITKEGYYWIEEYPNSKRSPQVINGFINGIIGLKEYVDFVPSDTLASKMLSETYKGLTNSLSFFDSKNWTYYNRASKKLSNNYLRYQIIEMKHLYEVFSDSIFIKQMMLWSVMAHNKYPKKDDLKHQFKKYNPSELATKKDNKYYGFLPSDKKTIIDSIIFDSVLFYSEKALNDYLSNNNPLFKRRKKDSIKLYQFKNDVSFS